MFETDAEALPVLKEGQAAQAFLIEFEEYTDCVANRAVITVALHGVLLSLGPMQFLVIRADPPIDVIEINQEFGPLLRTDPSEDVLL